MDDASIHEENQVKLDKLRLYVKYILTFQELGLRMKFLMFVESLTEAKKIATFLGSGWSMRTSIGYVHDLQKEKFMLLVPATSLDEVLRAKKWGGNKPACRGEAL